MRHFGRIGLLAVFGLGVLAASARADEEKIPLSKVPKAVIDAFKGKFPEAKINTAIKEEEDGKTVYEIESTLNGLAVDCVLKPDGEFVEIEKQIKADALPAAVADALKTKYPNATWSKIEEVTKGDKVSYEVVVKKADGKSVGVALDTTGKVLEEEAIKKD